MTGIATPYSPSKAERTDVVLAVASTADIAAVANGLRIRTKARLAYGRGLHVKPGGRC
jgi:hypothetical protein